jgi:NNP family nitrate/nitrite transporter-like MFS transporter
MASKRWLILLMVSLAAFAFLFSMQAAPPLIPAIISDFHLSHTAVAGVMLFVALPAMFLSIPGGFLADRYGNKRLSIVGLSLVCLGTFITAVAPSFSLLQAGRAVLGIGGAFLLSAAPPMIFQWFNRRELGLAMGIWALNMPLATVISFNLLGWVEKAYGWRSSFWIATILVSVILILFVLLAEERKVVRTAISLAPLKRVSMWMLALVWSTFNMAALSLTTWGKTIFMEFKGVLPVQADFLAGLIMLLAFTTPLMGYLAGRIGRCRPLILLSLIGMTVCLALMSTVDGGLQVSLLVVLGLFAALAPPCIFALSPELVGAENTGLGFGMLNTALNFGVLIGPLIVGQVLDTVHSSVVVFSTMAFFAALGALVAYFLKAR